MRFAILATGPSMSQALADRVRDRCKVIAVSDAFKLAPWADALVSSDSAWWRFHKPEFQGLSFSMSGCEGTEKLGRVRPGSNSGVLAIKVARHLGAKQIVLLGFDGHGSHFFGPHPEPLKNTNAGRRRVHADQHRQEALLAHSEGIQIFNCTEGTALTCYPIAKLEDVLAA